MLNNCFFRLQKCKCTDPHIKKSSCGRAYLQGGCRSCNSLYVELKQGEVEAFPEDYTNKVEAIRLRRGCVITAYTEEDFDGEEVTISQEVYEKFQGKTISSYECKCNDLLYKPMVPPARPSSCK